jgi:hypothetical protein
MNKLKFEVICLLGGGGDKSLRNSKSFKFTALLQRTNGSEKWFGMEMSGDRQSGQQAVQS